MDLGRLGRRLATALVLGTALTGRQIASWGTPRNRWDYFWQRQDAVDLILAVLILSAFLFVAGSLLAGWRWFRERRLHEYLLVLAIVAAILSQFPALNKDTTVPRAALLWALVLAVTGLAWHRWRDRMARVARAACLIMFPLVPILFLQILSWKPWDLRETGTRPPPPAANGTGRPFVVYIIFDEWSWFRFAPDGLPAPEYVNARKLAERSVLVREARSAGPATRYAIPRFLFATHGEIVPGDGTARWKDSTGSRPVVEVPSLFDRMHELGYRSSVLGFYLNYRSMIGPDAPDRVWSLSYVYKRTSRLEEIGLMLMRNLQHWTDPLSQSVWPPLSTSVYSDSWVNLFRTMRASALEALAKEPDNTFLLLHLPLPHAPFVFNADGSFRGRYQGVRLSEDTAGYNRHLLYADKVLGEILHTLDSAGRLDQSLVVVTSDHAWRREPDSALAKRPDAGLRVPLMVKWPGQRTAIVSDSVFCALGTWPIVEAAVTPASPPPMTDSLWLAISRQGRAARCRE
ncbi:MAG TPA: sulfatase-like hydrolase/transferase [Gemmatimonadales bacterium]|nr:sulfatase-like hydrolase/transferase [Gemmatimonadales bacterium]